MARAAYQHIPNLILGRPKKPKKKKSVKSPPPVKGTSFSPSSFVVPPKPVRPKLKIKF